MGFHCLSRARLLPLLAALLYVLGTAADPLLHAHVGDDAHAHDAHALCPTDAEVPTQGHDPAQCAVCRLSAAAAEAGEPQTLRAVPHAEPPPRERPRPGRSPLAHLAPAPRGPPHG